MKHKQLTCVERFEQSSPEHRRMFHYQQLILDVTEEICRVMDRPDRRISRAMLARRMKCSVESVSLLLNGRTLNLRKLIDICDALKVKPVFRLVDRT